MAAEANTNLIVNGSFEEFDVATSVRNATWWGVRSLPGWVLEGTAKDQTNWFEVVDSGHRGIVSDHGTHWLDMDAAGTRMALHQTVEGVEGGKQYTLSIRLASSNYGEGVDVYWAGVKLATVVPTSIAMDTVTFTVTGSADAAQNVLRLVGTGAADGFGVALDDVSLVRNADAFYADPEQTFLINAVHEGTADAQSFEVGAGSGRQFVNSFDLGEDRIRIRADLAASWADLQTKAVIYQSDASAVVEFHNGNETLVLTQFDSNKLGPSAFVFDALPTVSSAVVGNNLVRNGSFESTGTAARMGWGVASTTLEGWTLAGTAKTGSNWFEVVYSGHRNVAAADGKYWLDMDASSGNIGLSQMVDAVEAGRTYTLSFSAATSRAGNAVDVYWAGSKIATVVPDGLAMQTFSFVVEGYNDRSLNQLGFKSAGAVDGIGVSLDNVSLFAHEAIVEQPDVYTFGLGDGRLYVIDFKLGFDRIDIRDDFFSSFEEMMENATASMDGRTTIIEFSNGRESIVLPQFDVGKLSAEMFAFIKPERSSELQEIAKLVVGDDLDNTLIAGAGDQTIDGGAGFDVLTGGVGADSFLYNAKSGHDFITDFNDKLDRIIFSADVAESYDHLMSFGAIYQDGRSTQIELGEGRMITLFGTDATQVSADWFVFTG